MGLGSVASEISQLVLNILLNILLFPRMLWYDNCDMEIMQEKQEKISDKYTFYLLLNF